MTTEVMRRRIGVLCITACVVVSACTTLDPYTGEEQASRAQRGAIIGAVSGAVAGLITGDSSMERKKRALVGAGLGALAGGAVGAYQDRQEMQLRNQLEGTGVSVSRIGDNITLNMPGNITFATGSADLNAGFFAVLDSVALVVNEFEQTVIEVAGHTDSVGAADYNQGLSERRAATVRDYLINAGAPGAHLSARGYGEAQPIADNGTREGRAQNRRVELTLVPLTLG